MYTLGKKTGGYKGGSLRDRSTPQPSSLPKPSTQEDVNNLLSSISNSYYEHAISKENLEYLTAYLTSFKNKEDYRGDVQTSPIASRVILLIKTLYADNKIGENYLDTFISGVQDIISNVTPRVIVEKKPKEEINTGYTGGSTRDRSTPQHEIVVKTYTQKDIDDFVGSVSNSYYERAITKEDIYFVTHYLSAFADGGSYQGEYTSTSITYRLVSTVEGLLADGKIDTEYIKSIVSGVSLIPSTVVQMEIKVVEPKEQLNFNKNYKK